MGCFGRRTAALVSDGASADKHTIRPRFLTAPNDSHPRAPPSSMSQLFHILNSYLGMASGRGRGCGAVARLICLCLEKQSEASGATMCHCFGRFLTLWRISRVKRVFGGFCNAHVIPMLDIPMRSVSFRVWAVLDNDKVINDGVR